MGAEGSDSVFGRRNPCSEDPLGEIWEAWERWMGESLGGNGFMYFSLIFSIPSDSGRIPPG